MPWSSKHHRVKRILLPKRESPIRLVRQDAPACALCREVKDRVDRLNFRGELDGGTGRGEESGEDLVIAALDGDRGGGGDGEGEGPGESVDRRRVLRILA
jgi:hypothetical protein